MTDNLLPILAMIVSIAGAIWAGRDTSVRISKTKIEIEKTLREMLDAETIKTKQLRDDLERAGRQIEELLFGVDILMRQIEQEFNGIPRWNPKRNREEFHKSNGGPNGGSDDKHDHQATDHPGRSVL